MSANGTTGLPAQEPAEQPPRDPSMPPAAAVPDPDASVPPYSWYALSVLVLLYVLNFVDRQILSILANDIKADLGLSDADLGFLYGTAFAVFYSLFGIPLGKLADSWHRVRLMTLGLTLWSVMTAVSGFAKNGAQLTIARIGVGVGEATASPSAYSLISDFFPARLRATALAIYSSGIYIGGGVSLLIGGLIVEEWNAAFPGGGPFGLVGWQAAFVAVGLPGLLLALWVITLREPVRGAIDGLPTKSDPHPFRGFFRELVSVIPPLTLIGAAKRGPAALALNLMVAVLAIGIAYALTIILDSGEGDFVTAITNQWLFLAVGYYAVYCWASTLRQSDPPSFQADLGVARLPVHDPGLRHRRLHGLRRVLLGGALCRARVRGDDQGRAGLLARRRRRGGGLHRRDRRRTDRRPPVPALRVGPRMGDPVRAAQARSRWRSSSSPPTA